jgi:predicted nucleotidyltransferase
LGWAKQAECRRLLTVEQCSTILIFMAKIVQQAPITKADIFKILQEHREHIKALGVQRLGIFGSFVRGEQTEQSDVDILVQFAPGKKSFDNFIQLAFLLEELLHRRVELVTVESVSPYIRPYILREVEYVSFSA